MKMVKNSKDSLKNSLRIYFILADENLFHPAFLKGIIAYANQNKYKIVGITIAKDTYKKGFFYAVRQQIRLWGYIGFLFIVTSTLYNTFLSTFGFTNESTIQGIAQAYGIAVKNSLNVNAQEHIRYLLPLHIDIIISSNGHIFKKELLSLPKIACINRHSGLLPQYGGVLPVFWAMYHHEKYFGVSAHYMVEKIDQGDILDQTKIVINKKNSLFRNYMIAFDKSISVTTNAIENAKNNRIIAKFSQNKKSYFSFPSKDIINEFKKDHKSFNLNDICFYYMKKNI